MSANITIVTHQLGDQRVGRIADMKTLTNDETIQEALDLGYVVGQPSIISANVKGVLKAMLNGLQKDGDGRKVDRILSLQVYANGSLDDVCDDLDRSKIAFKAAARVLKDLKIDTSGWTFTVEGATGALVISSISTGEMAGVIVPGEAVAINGSGLMDGDVTITWAVPEKSKTGTVAAAKITRDATRITLAADALSELDDPQYNDKTIVFNIKVGNRTAVKSALLNA